MLIMDTLRTIIGGFFVALMLAVAPTAVALNNDTTCMAPLPWSSSFEPDRDSLQCWNIVHECGGYPSVYHGYVSTGGYSLAMTSTSAAQPCMIATPRMAHRADSLHISFMLTMAMGNGTLQVGLMDSVFVPLMTVALDDARLGIYEFYTDDFPSDDSLRVAFRVTNGRICIDDIEVEAATLCRRPCGAWVENIDLYGITLGWNACGGMSYGFVVRAVDTAAHDTVDVLSDDTTFIFGAMNAGTTYDMSVAAVCGLDTTDWFHLGLVTTEVACRQVAEASVGALTATAAGLQWEYDTMGINEPMGMLLTINDLNSNAAPQQFNVSTNYLFANNLATGHRYEVTLRTLCMIDTSAPISLTFMPMNDACTEAEGTSTSLVFPLAVGSPYSYSQMLYPASVLSGMDTIYALAFRVVGTPILYGPRTVDVYIGQTSDSTLGSTVGSMMMTQVINNATVNPAEAGWTILPLDFPLAVNQSRNLLVTILDNTGAAGGQLRFGTHYSSVGGTLYASSPDNPFDPSVPDMVMMSSSAVADIQLFGDCAAPSCVAPAAMVTAVGSSSLTLGWAGASGSCAVRYRVAGSEQWHLSAPHTGSCTLSGLNPATRYEMCVGTICGGDTVYGTLFDAATYCGTVAVPYLADFMHGVNACWQGFQNTFAGGLRLGGTIVSPEIGQAANTLQMTLSVAGSGMLYIGVCDAGGMNIQWLDTVDVYLPGDYTVYLDGYTGTERHIAIAGSSVALVLREVLVEQLDDCLPPRNLAVNNVTGNGATLTWNGTAALYEVYLAEVGTDRISSWQTTSTQFVFNGLEGNTAYEGYVISVCGGTHSVMREFSFATPCEDIAYFPYEQSFETPQAPAQCWRMVYADQSNMTLNPMTHTTAQACHGQRSFRFSSYNYVQSDIYDQYLVSPRIAAEDSIWLQFRYRKDNIEPEPFSVGFSTTGNNVDDFLWLGTEQASAGEWLQYNVGLPATTRYVAIHYMGQNSYYLYIDDLRITGPGCEAPTITMVDEQVDAVSLAWTAVGGTSYVAITDGVWLSSADGIAVTGNEYTFSGLEQGRRYTVGVRSLCPDGHLSDWTTQQVVTISTSCTAPVDLAAEEVEYNGAHITWQPMGDAQSWQLSLLADGVLIDMYPPVNVPSAHFIGLEQGRAYSVLVRSLCGDIPGPWSDTLTFNTLECATVSDATYERIDFRTVSFSWHEAPVSTGQHRVEYGVQGFQRGTGRVVESHDMPLTIVNLEPEYNYDFYIQNYCQPDVLSEAAVLVSVPSGMGIGEVDLAPLKIYPSPASRQVTVSVAGIGASVEVLDIAGRIVHVARQTDSQSVTIDVSDYPVGTYYVRITDAFRSAVGKFTVGR
ncbi:MAG: choice-of-anchor J domain-containing protein [Bacteroidales bacterium]|nr:choice-of-anchor J domain-containing protein [Bacteroidales bacterium]